MMLYDFQVWCLKHCACGGWVFKRVAGLWPVIPNLPPPRLLDICVPCCALCGCQKAVGKLPTSELSDRCSPFLPPSLSLHSSQANRWDLLYCIKSKGMFDLRKGLACMPTLMSAFARFILNPVVRPFVLLLFGLTSTFSFAFAFKISIGLDQTLALPKVRGRVVCWVG